MKVLNGSELAGFIKERQAKEVRTLIQADRINPKLSIIVTVDNPVIDLYVRLKKAYGSDIQVEVEVHRISQEDCPELINKLSNDKSVHGIIVQLPLSDPTQTKSIVNLVPPEKDVDALGASPSFDPATPMAILWLLAGYNIDVQGRKVLLIGRGTLVGRPLEKILLNSGVDVSVADSKTTDLMALTSEADIIVTATGKPGLLRPDMVKSNCVIIDAGVASENGKTVGDVSLEMYDREDISITPTKGGVGPLTVCALFENVIRAARQQALSERK